MTQAGGGELELSRLTLEEITALVDSHWPWPLDAVQYWFEDLYNRIQWWTYSNARDAIEYVLSYWSGVWETLKTKVRDSLDEFFSYAWSFWHQLSGYVEDAIGEFFRRAYWFWDRIKEGTNWLGQELTWRLSWLSDQVVYHIQWLWGNIYPFFQNLISQIVEKASWLWDTISPHLHQILLAFGPLGVAIDMLVPTLRGAMLEDLKATWDFMGDNFTRIPELFSEYVSDPITDFFDSFISAFTSYFGSLWQTIWETLNSWWQTITGFFTQDLVQGIVSGFQWVTDWFSEAVENIFSSLLSFLKAHSPITPEDAPSSAAGLMSILGISAAGLGVMTAAGELMHPLATWNLGHLSAMIGDVVNYRAITGIIMGGILSSTLRTPLNYYVNDMVRPWLPDRRSIMDMRSRQLIGRDKFNKLIAYQGLGDDWLDSYDKMTESGVGYFALRAVADSGFFDKGLFERDLRRRGHAQETIDQLLVMYEAMAHGDAKGMMSGAAINSFKEGYYDEATLRRNLETLGYKEPGISVMVFAAQLDYQRGVVSDLLAGYREAYRKDVITEREFRSSLSELGIIADRIDTYVWRENVKKFGKMTTI